MPSILFINRVYPPDAGATGRVLERVACHFKEKDWEVRILTTAGSKTRRGVMFFDEMMVVRTGVPFLNANLFLRALGYALMIPSLLVRALLMPRADIVVTMTDPPMLLVIGPVLKFFKGSRLIHWAQDLYPEVAEEAGVLAKGGIVAGILKCLSTLSMERHARIVAVGQCMVERIAARGISPSRIVKVANIGIEQEIVLAPRFPNAFREMHGLGDDFLVMYSGNMGRAHEFSTALEAARQLQKRGESDILFLFVGGGPMESALRLKVERLGLHNVRFLESQPAESLSISLAAADLHLVTMREGMEGLVVPSKFYGVMAAGRSCLFVGPPASEIARVIHEQSAGIVISPGDTDSLISAILEHRNSPDRFGDFQEMGHRAQIFLQRESGAIRFLMLATALISPSRVEIID